MKYFLYLKKRNIKICKTPIEINLLGGYLNISSSKTHYFLAKILISQLSLKFMSLATHISCRKN